MTGGMYHFDSLELKKLEDRCIANIDHCGCMSVGFGSDVDDDHEEIHLNLSDSQLSEIRLAFEEVSA